MLQTAIKILVFLALVGGFFYFSSDVPNSHEFRAVRRAVIRAGGIFMIGAALAVWGDKKIGTLDPISLRGVFIALGILLMILGGILIYALQQPSA